MITNAKVIGENVSFDKSREGQKQRGDAGFVMSRSELVEFSRNPKRWLDGFGIQDEGTEATQWGSLIDALLISPESFDRQFAPAPETYPDTKTGEPKPFTMQSKWCKDWAASQGGKQIVKKPLMDEAQTAVKAMRENEVVAELLPLCKRQVFVTATWADKETKLQIPLIGLIDLVPPSDHPAFGKTLCDLKTARNGDPASWARVVDDSGYDVQSALYIDIFTAATGEDRTDFVHIVQENIPPYHVVNPLPALTSEFLNWGRLKYQAALKYYCKCLATGVWPSYRVVGMPYQNLQLIGPENLWRYRELAGQGSLSSPLKSPIQPTEQTDIIP